MEILPSFIELLVGFRYLIGHYLLSKKRIYGWLVKLVGGIAWTIFLFLNENYIFSAVAFVIMLTMIMDIISGKLENIIREPRLIFILKYLL